LARNNTNIVIFVLYQLNKRTMLKITKAFKFITIIFMSGCTVASSIHLIDNRFKFIRSIPTLNFVGLCVLLAVALFLTVYSWVLESPEKPIRNSFKNNLKK